MKEKVMLGVLSMGHSINTGLFLWISNLKRTINESGRDFALFHVNGANPVEFARNRCIQDFLKSDCDRLWFIDDDVNPPWNAWKILDVDADITIGLTPIFLPGTDNRGAALHYNVFDFVGEKDKFLAMKEVEEDQTVDAGGCASMVIRRSVLEDSSMRQMTGYLDIMGTPRNLTAEDAPPIFRRLYKPNGEVLIGEDLDFCWRAKQNGYSIRAATATAFGHLKHVDLAHVTHILEELSGVKGGEPLPSSEKVMAAS